MAIKKINKAINLTSIIITMLLVMAIFFGTFNWYSKLLSNNGGVVGEQYQNISNALIKDQNDINNNMTLMKTTVVNGVFEADSIYQATWNAFKGLGVILKMPVVFIDTGSDILDQLITPMDFVPPWVKALSLVGISVVIILLIVALLKGEQNKT